MLQIETVGLDQYAPGGSAFVQVLIVGGPGVGKTRMASFFPRPIYADCEKGMGSVADRSGVKRVAIKTSKDMLDLLVLLKQECAKPTAERLAETLVVDTVDTYQRLVLEEWHELNPQGTNNKYDIWNYLGRAMATLTTRALNLDMNVVMLVHESNKEVDETLVHSLQLKGGGKEEIYNDFDFVGWLRTEWDAVDGERRQRRLLTFHPRPGREWLKDRLHVTPPELEVTFSDTDYTQLFAAIVDRLDEFEPSEIVGEVPSVDPDNPDGVVAVPSEDVVAPGEVEGALPPQPPAEEKLTDLTKAGLMEKAGEVGAKVNSSMKKEELLAAVEAKLAEPDPEPEEQSDPEPEPEPSSTPPFKQCEECGKDLSGETPDYVRIAEIKYRKSLCDEHFLAMRK